MLKRNSFPLYIYGFIGENGSGKSTTEKIICGLIHPSGGQVQLFGRDYTDPDIRAAVGVLIEAPGCFPNYSVWNNMMLQAANLRIPNARAEVVKVLKMVRMEGAASNKYKNCSLGMKQRIGMKPSWTITSLSSGCPPWSRKKSSDAEKWIFPPTKPPCAMPALFGTNTTASSAGAASSPIVLRADPLHTAADWKRPAAVFDFTKEVTTVENISKAPMPSAKRDAEQGYRLTIGRDVIRVISVFSGTRTASEVIHEAAVKKILFEKAAG